MRSRRLNDTHKPPALALAVSFWVVAKFSVPTATIAGTRTLYEPFGAPLTTPREGAPSYTGHQFDSSTGLSYAQQRYYDPQLGVFYSPDPMAVDTHSAINFNRYAYANNSPYRFVDPDGRGACDGISTCRVAAEEQAVARGEMTQEQKQENDAARGVGAIIAAPVAAAIIIATPEAAVGGGIVAAAKVASRAEQVVVRTTRSGDRAVRITKPNGAVKDISPQRVKEYVPNTHPKAPSGALEKVKFPNAQPGSKGVKRDPTPEEVDILKNTQ